MRAKRLIEKLLMESTTYVFDPGIPWDKLVATFTAGVEGVTIMKCEETNDRNVVLTDGTNYLHVMKSGSEALYAERFGRNNPDDILAVIESTFDTQSYDEHDEEFEDHIRDDDFIKIDLDNPPPGVEQIYPPKPKPPEKPNLDGPNGPRRFRTPGKPRDEEE
jgi:hypothetical protein